MLVGYTCGYVLIVMSSCTPPIGLWHYKLVSIKIFNHLAMLVNPCKQTILILDQLFKYIL